MLVSCANSRNSVVSSSVHTSLVLLSSSLSFCRPYRLFLFQWTGRRKHHHLFALSFPKNMIIFTDATFPPPSSLETFKSIFEDFLKNKFVVHGQIQDTHKNQLDGNPASVVASLTEAPPHPDLYSHSATWMYREHKRNSWLSEGGLSVPISDSYRRCQIGDGVSFYGQLHIMPFWNEMDWHWSDDVLYRMQHRQDCSQGQRRTSEKTSGTRGHRGLLLWSLFW